MTHLSRSLILGCSVLALSACGPDDIASPGSGGNVTVTITTPPPAPTPTPTAPTLVTAAGACPTITDPQGLTDKGTISGPTGTYRICQLPALIKVSSTLPKITGLLYSMSGRVNVGCDGGFTAPTAGSPVASTTVGCGTLTADTNVTLTINPGVILYGATGQSWLAVNRGNKLNAVGTATSPIIFTSADNVAGFNTDQSIGQWGGVVLLGRGKITDCNVGSVASSTCERDTEGSVDLARFGGNDDTYNAGTLSYLQIRYSGFVLSADKELQALTTEGIGSGTVIDHFQSHNSSDDGAEFFGGVVNMKYYIATGADDDSLDVDTGARMSVQYALLLQRPGQGDSMMEIDSNGFEADTPRTNLKVSNFVAVQPQVSANNEGADQATTMFRGNSDTTLVNGLIVAPNNECIRMNGSGGANAATLTARSVALTCNATKYIGSGSYTAAQVATSFGSGTNNNNDALTSTLTGGFINGANEDAIVPFDASTLSTFFVTPSPNHAGAVWSGNNTWFMGWTCNSSTANLGGGSACTSLPTT
ncbi:MAG: hypothetical protein ABIT16_01615 [Croceibacterium sp.]